MHFYVNSMHKVYASVLINMHTDTHVYVEGCVVDLYC